MDVTFLEIFLQNVCIFLLAIPLQGIYLNRIIAKCENVGTKIFSIVYKLFTKTGRI